MVSLIQTWLWAPAMTSLGLSRRREVKHNVCDIICVYKNFLGLAGMCGLSRGTHSRAGHHHHHTDSSAWGRSEGMYVRSRARTLAHTPLSPRSHQDYGKSQIIVILSYRSSETCLTQRNSLKIAWRNISEMWTRKNYCKMYRHIWITNSCNLLETSDFLQSW